MNSKKYVAYYRVSTQKQGNSGLGLEAQKQQVANFVNCKNCIIAEYVEIESGKNDARTELQRAIEAANKAGATLVIAKLDRLSRNAGFIFALRDSGVQFVCVDMPDANTLTIGIFAVMAQHERELISSRTKAGLAVKAQQLAKEGKKLGSPQNLNLEARQKGHAAIKANALNNKENKQATAIATQMRKAGATLQSIADHLNKLDYKTRTGKNFVPTNIMLLLNRAGITKPAK